jgi:hypothetical protein
MKACSWSGPRLSFYYDGAIGHWEWIKDPRRAPQGAPVVCILAHSESGSAAGVRQILVLFTRDWVATDWSGRAPVREVSSLSMGDDV